VTAGITGATRVYLQHGAPEHARADGAGLGEPVLSL